MPLCSMTGYGRGERESAGGLLRVEIRSVNNRFLDIQLRTSSFFMPLEARIKKAISRRVSRGSVTVVLYAEKADLRQTPVYNRELVDGYVGALREIKRRWDLAGPVSMADLLRCGDLFSLTAESLSLEEMWKQVGPVLNHALEDFLRSREAEAASIKKAFERYLREEERLLVKIRKRAPQRVKKYREDLKKRIAQLLQNPPEPQRLAAEVAYMADKLEISEECVRLEAHIEAFTKSLESREPVGKRLNFLLQEMNREANTIGSKANDQSIARYAIALKESIERLREQVQNIE